MFKNNFFISFHSMAMLIAATTLTAGCGGGTTASNSEGANTTSNNIVTGVASKGPLNGATVCAYAITGDAKGAPIGNCATTDSAGNYSINLGVIPALCCFKQPVEIMSMKRSARPFL